MKKAFAIGVTALTALFLAACGSSTKKAINAPKADYTTAAKLETALNAGKKVTGKTVQFKIATIEPTSAFGYNLEAGKHLNFVSTDGKDVKSGDTVTAKVKKAASTLGSWVITYSSLKKNGKTVATKAANKATKSADTSTPKTTPTDANHAWYFKDPVFYAGNETMTLTKSEIRDGAETGTKVLVIYSTIRNNSSKEQDPSNFYMVIHAKQKTDTSNVDLTPGTIAVDDQGNDPLQAQEDNLNNALLPGKTVETVIMFDLKNTAPVTVTFQNEDFSDLGSKEYSVQ